MGGPKAREDDFQTKGVINYGRAIIPYEIMGSLRHPDAHPDKAQSVIAVAATAFLGPDRFFNFEEIAGSWRDRYTTQMVKLDKQGVADYIVRTTMSEYVANIQFTPSTEGDYATPKAVMYYDPTNETH